MNDSWKDSPRKWLIAMVLYRRVSVYSHLLLISVFRG